VRWLAMPVLNVSGILYTVPSLAVLALALPILGIGFRPSLFALTVLAVLPIFLNTLIGIKSADPAVVDAARGMGTSNRQLLLMVEMPLAMPFLFAGIQTAVVQSIGLATLAAYIGGGGFGDWILQGLAINRFPILLAGAVPVALMAMTAEVLLGSLRRLVVPKGLTVE
jgi:osmoprotectant transport system permease protein